MSQILDARWSGPTLNEGHFSQLLKLCAERPWLLEKPDALSQLWQESIRANATELMRKLLADFTFVDGSKLESALAQIAQQVCRIWGLDPGETKLFAISDDRAPDGSQGILNALKLAFAAFPGWTEGGNFANSLVGFNKSSANVKQIVLVDDFIGSAHTISRRVDWAKMRLARLDRADSKIYVVGLAGMEDAKYVLTSLAIEGYFAPMWLDRAITDRHPPSLVAEAVQAMIRLERGLAAKCGTTELSSLSFGYAKSEATFAVRGYSIPDNVFPIFWWPLSATEQHRAPLFQRIQK